MLKFLRLDLWTAPLFSSSGAIGYKRRNERFLRNIKPFVGSKRIVTRIFVRGFVLRSILSKLIVVASFLCLLPLAVAGQHVSSTETGNLFPKTVGDFRLQAASQSASILKEFAPEDFNVRASGESAFVSPQGERLTVTVVKTGSQDAA